MATARPVVPFMWGATCPWLPGSSPLMKPTVFRQRSTSSSGSGSAPSQKTHGSTSTASAPTHTPPPGAARRRWAAHRHLPSDRDRRPGVGRLPAQCARARPRLPAVRPCRRARSADHFRGVPRLTSVCNRLVGPRGRGRARSSAGANRRRRCGQRGTLGSRGIGPTNAQTTCSAAAGYQRNVIRM